MRFDSSDPVLLSRLPILVGFATAIVIVIATPAWSSDGVLEVSQTCALQTGCFAGDAPGFPITISAAGSYRLTSNLIVPDEDTDGIVIATSDVGIDLNGFAILRSGCEGATTSCMPEAGSGSGIERTSPENRGISARNGSVTGMGRYGLYLGGQAEVRNVRARWNRLTGIFASTGSTVSGNTAYGNGLYGISAAISSTVVKNTAYANGSIGIFGGGTISMNTTHSNGTDGIHASNGSTVSGNSSLGNTGDGISTSQHSLIHGNVVRGNQQYGLDLGAGTAYRENVINSNTAGTVQGGVDLGANSCNGTTICP